MSDDYQAYLEKRHARFQTPEEVVLAMASRATGRQAVALDKIVRGNDNEVYIVSAEGGDQCVVRICRGGEVRPQAEAWAMQQCAKAGVPVPTVHLVGRDDLDGQTVEFMVQSRVPGRPLSEVIEELTESELASVGRQAGEVLGKLHGIEVGGFYHLSQDGKWDFPTWRAVMDSAVRDRSAEKELILGAGFAEDEFAQMVELLRQYRDGFDCPQPVLCHGDFLSEHIFVDSNLHITGVLDFGGHQGGHPVHDFAVLSMAGTRLKPTMLLPGYPDSPFLADRFEQRLLLHRLSLEMGYLAHHMRIGHHPEIAANTHSLRETLDALNPRGQ